MPQIRTVSSPVTVELEKIKGSRFVGHIAPVSSEQHARSVIDERRDAAPEATHHCWAFRLAEGRELADDDGEPGGTSGPPILRHLVGADLVDVVAVVTRWYGGTKLGTGGLVRAYGAATAAALATAEIETTLVRTELALCYGYDFSGGIEAVINAHDVTLVSAEYTDVVKRRVAVVTEHVDDFIDAVTDATSGNVVPVRF